jgi:hypothetical protein
MFLDPHVAITAVHPVTLFVDCFGVRPHCPLAGIPQPVAIPRPKARNPFIIRSRRSNRFLYSYCRRGFSDDYFSSHRRFRRGMLHNDSSMSATAG